MKFNFGSFLLGMIAGVIIFFCFYSYLLSTSTGEENIIPDKDVYFAKIEKICLEKGKKDSLKSPDGKLKLASATYHIDSLEIEYRCDSRKSISISFSKQLGDTLIITDLFLGTENDKYQMGDHAYTLYSVPKQTTVSKNLTKNEVVHIFQAIR